MATRQETAISVTPTADITTIAALRTTMAAGSVITANNINTLASFINNWLGHYHTYNDAYSLKTYGNTGSSSPTVSKNTSTLIGAPTTISAVTNSTIIAATKHNEFRSVSNTLAHHYHTIDDRTAI